MPFTISYRRGNVVLVPFPFTDLSSAKQRPALVISNDVLNAKREDVPATLEEDEFLIPASDLSVCGLPKPSLIRLTKLVALYRQVVIKRTGALPAATLDLVLARIRLQF